MADIIIYNEYYIVELSIFINQSSWITLRCLATNTIWRAEDDKTALYLSNKGKIKVIEEELGMYVNVFLLVFTTPLKTQNN